LMIQENSPAEKAGLESFFDYIVAINDIRLDQEDPTFVDQLKANMNKECKLNVYNSKTQQMRETKIIPNDTWGGVGLLGARIRFCSFEGASENVWHILNVYPNSPAAKAGLKSHTDYIIAAPDALLHDQSAFGELVEQFQEKALKLYVYSSETDNCREVTITPNKSWGGQGSLGCDVGYGYLHRIPNPNAAAAHSSDCNDPGHNHGHSHSHSSSHSHSHGEACDDHSHSHGAASPLPAPAPSSSHSHSHGSAHAHAHGEECHSDHSEEEESDCDDPEHSHSHGSHGHAHSTPQPNPKSDPIVTNTADGFSTISLEAPSKSN